MGDGVSSEIETPVPRNQILEDKYVCVWVCVYQCVGLVVCCVFVCVFDGKCMCVCVLYWMCVCVWHYVCVSVPVCGWCLYD